MKWIRLAAIFGAMLIVGCATSPYRPAEKYLDKKDYSQAIRAYLLELEPHLKDGRRFIYYDKQGVTGIGEVYWHMQRYETAIKILKMVLEKDPTYGKAILYLGMSYEGLGNEDEAIRAYRNYSLLPDNDIFRQVLAGRLDWIIQNKIARDIELASSRKPNST
jgi:tetratricopeptide (TPR) repeat protein